MKKDISYYLNLNYKIQIIPISKEMGGGYEASIPELGKYAFIGYGETLAEAIKDLNKTKKQYFKEFIQKNIEIPEPEDEEREFRGEFLLRMPKFLHKELYEAAKENETSLNQYLNVLIAKNFQIHQVGELFNEFIKRIWKKSWRQTPQIIDIEIEEGFKKLNPKRRELGV